MKVDTIPPIYLNGFMSALHQGDSKTVRDLLKMIPSLVNVNNGDKESTPLFLAVRNGHADIIKILIKYGATVNLTTKHFRTLIQMIVDKGGKETEEMCRALVESGTDLNRNSLLGLTLMRLATNSKREDVARVLLKLGADVNMDGGMCLHYAASSGAERMCELLVEGGANVNAKYIHGLTPLHMAARAKHIGTMEILLNSGADIDARDKDGNTPLHLASEFGRARAVLTLIENGANVNIVNRRGKTAFNVALFRNWTAYQLDLLKMQIATKEGNLEDLGITIDRSEQVQLMRKYDEEVQRMRSLEISGTSVTFHDILTKSVEQIALYARNADVVQAFRLRDYQKEFPEYAGLIEGRFKSGVARKELLDEGHRFFLGRFSETKNLPYNCTDKILNYLNNRDVTNLKRSCPF